MKVFTKESMEELTGGIDLFEVVKSLGVKDFQNLNSLGMCPICKHYSSFAIENVNAECYCFECEFKGNAIDLLMAVKRMSFEEAVSELAKMFNVEMEYKEFDKFPRSKSNNKDKQDFNKFLNLMKKFEELL